MRLRIMQPTVPQDAKFSYANKAQVMQHYLALSDRATGPQSSGVRDATHLIWPESAFPFFLTREADALAVQNQELERLLRDPSLRVDALEAWPERHDQDGEQCPGGDESLPRAEPAHERRRNDRAQSDARKREALEDSKNTAEDIVLRRAL